MSEGVQGRLPLSDSSQSLWLAVWSAWSSFATEEQSTWASKSHRGGGKASEFPSSVGAEGRGGREVAGG